MKRKHIPRRYVLEPDTMFDCYDAEQREDLLSVKAKIGISPDEVYDLASSLGVWMTPRLEYFIKRTISYPCQFKSLASWKRCLYKMLYFFRKLRDDDTPISKKEDPRFWQGYRLFTKYMLTMWW